MKWSNIKKRRWNTAAGCTAEYNWALGVFQSSRGEFVLSAAGLLFLISQSINIIAYHVFIVDKQIVIAVATIPIFFAEACRHIAIVPWLTPKRSVITAKIKATSGKTLFVLHCLSETLHRCRPTIFFDSGKPNTLPSMRVPVVIWFS